MGKLLYEKGINTSEFMDNREVTQALDMLRIIFEDVNPEDFTLEEIQAEFNAIGPVGDKKETIYQTTRVRYGPSHIETLLDKGLIEEADEKDHYRATEVGSQWYEESAEDEASPKEEEP